MYFISFAYFALYVSLISTVSFISQQYSDITQVSKCILQNKLSQFTKIMNGVICHKCILIEGGHSVNSRTILLFSGCAT